MKNEDLVNSQFVDLTYLPNISTLNIMSKTVKLFLSIIILFSLIGTGFVLFKYVKDGRTALAPNLPGSVEIASAEPVSTIDEVHSADGAHNFINDKTVQSTGNTIYTLYAADIPQTSKNLIYETTLPKGSNLSIPVNSWSPNNKFVFVKESTSSSSSYLVFNASGEKFGDDQFIDVGKAFDSKDNGFTLDDVSGWDSDTLLHVDASNADSHVHFWLEVPSGAVIRLAR